MTDDYDSLRAKYDALLSTATALGAFAENHRKFVSAWGRVRAYLRMADDNAHIALPREVVLGVKDRAWTVRVVRVASGTGESVDVTEYEDTLFDYQDAPCPSLLGSWCERQMALAREHPSRARCTCGTATPCAVWGHS